MTPPTPGEVAYNAYCEARGWKSFAGDHLPPFEKVQPDIQAAWEAAGRAVIDQINTEPQPE